MNNFRILSGSIFCVALALVVALEGCGIDGGGTSEPADLQAFAWSPTATNPLDSGTGLVTDPQIAVAPNGGGVDRATAIWLEEKDENPFDNIPPISHLYARRQNFGFWDLVDTVCPLDGQFENINPGRNNGICLIDTGSETHSVSSHQIAMNNSGDAIAVWQQHDGTAQRVYARRFSGGSWGTIQQLNDSAEFANGDAADPVITMEADSTNNGGSDDGVGSAIAVWSQWSSSTGWQTMARRTVNGTWDTSDATICPAAGNGADDGICYISGSNSARPTLGPRVAMDNLGRAIAAFVQMNVQADCEAPNPPPNGNSTAINCSDDQLTANQFNGTSWQSPINLDPGLSSAGANQIICYEASNGAARGNATGSDACVTVVEYDLDVNFSGQAALLIKTAWKENEDWNSSGGCNGTHGGQCTPDGNAFEDFVGEAIVAREYTMGASWVTGSWTLTQLANFGYANGSHFGTGPYPAGCPAASRVTIDGGRVQLNCKFINPRIAWAPGGTTGMAVYETYDTGGGYNIRAHNFNGSWGAFATIDAGANEAHSPRIAMYSSGDGVAVWTQDDGSKFRVYSNCFATGAGTCGGGGGWQGAVVTDGNVGSESEYYSPVLAMVKPSGANSALSLFVGWDLGNNTTRLYSATGP